MTNNVRHTGFRPTAIALAVLAAFAPAAFAQTTQASASDAKAPAAQVEATISVGAAAASGSSSDRAIWGQYNGMRNQSGYGLLDFYYERRAEGEASFSLRGSNLGLQTRELEAVWKKQGDWKLSADYGELIRYNPYTINTGINGVGTTTPQVNYLTGGPGSGNDTDLKTKRTAIGLGLSKIFSPELALDVNLRTENKDGAQMFGRGFACPSANAPGCTSAFAGSGVLLIPEPINSNHSQLDARLSYAAGKLRMSGGYYGSFFSNSNSSLSPSIPGTLNNAIGAPVPTGSAIGPILAQPIALAPDNQAHQLDVTGLYAFTPTTRANFKVAYTQASQDQSFSSGGFTSTPPGVGNLGGKMNSTLAMLGITSRPMPKLSLLGDIRWDDREDKTPIAYYSTEGTLQSTNRSMPLQRLRGRLQASYQFPDSYVGTIGADYESIDRGSFTQTSTARGVSALRQETTEYGFRAEVRRRMTETINGALSYVSSQRTGSNWLRPNSGLGVTDVSDTGSGFASNAIFMPLLADRKRDKIKLTANWQATDQLSLQFTAEDGTDKFNTITDYGLSKSGMSFYSVDANYALSEQWNLSGWVSYGTQKLNQARPEGYVMSYDNRSTAVGLGVNGKPSGKIDVGGSLSYVEDLSRYPQGLDPLAGNGSVALLNATGGLPDITFRRTELRMYGRYALTEVSALRMDLVYFNAKYTDWAYAYGSMPYLFSDNSTASQDQKQSVTYLGVTYVHTLK